MPVVVAEEADAILLDVQTLVRAISLTGIDSDDIKIREMPKAGEVLDNLPCVIINSLGDLETESLDMEGNASRTHGVEICLIDAHEGDYATDRKKRAKWRSEVLNKIEFNTDGSWRLGLANVPSVWSIQIVQTPTLDRSKLPEGYAYYSVVVNFLSQE